MIRPYPTVRVLLDWTQHLHQHAQSLRWRGDFGQKPFTVFSATSDLCRMKKTSTLREESTQINSTLTSHSCLSGRDQRNVMLWNAAACISGELFFVAVVNVPSSHNHWYCDNLTQNLRQKLLFQKYTSYSCECRATFLVLVPRCGRELHNNSYSWEFFYSTTTTVDRFCQNYASI